MDTTYKSYIDELIKNNYLSNTDLQPLKCRFCDSGNLDYCNYEYSDIDYIQEYDCKCKDCGKINGHWAYGGWVI